MRATVIRVTLGVLLSSSPVRAGTDVWTPTGPPGANVGVIALTPNGVPWAGTSVGVYTTGSAQSTTWDLKVRLDGGARSLAIHPTQPSIMFAGTTGAVYRTNNGGTTWNRMINGLFAVVVDIAIDPQQPMNILIGTTGNCAFSSSDGGSTWAQRCNGLPARLQALTRDPATPSRAYAVGDGGIFRSTDNGLTWAAVLSGLDPLSVAGALAVDPSNPQTVYASFTGQYGGQHLYKTTDAGTNWTTLQDDGAPCAALAVDPDNPAIVYQMRAQGLAKSTDGGVTFTTVLPGNEVTDIAFNPADHSIIYAARTDGVRRSSDGGATWTAVDAGFRSDGIGAVAVNEASNTVMTAVYCSNIFSSTDEGATWTPSNVSSYGWAFATDPQSPLTVYAAITPSLLKSVDGGTTWTFLGNIPTGNPTDPFVQQATKVVVDPSTSPSTLYVATGYNGLFRSTDSATTWHQIGFPGMIVTDFGIDPQSPDTLWATTTNETGLAQN